jgi:hypothetical protein
MVTSTKKAAREDNSKTGHAEMTINLQDLYMFRPEDLNIDITTVHYSNLAYISCDHRNVFIDFLALPGVKKDGKMTVDGTRIFMSHAAAQKLALALGELLKQVYDQGQMETYTPNITKPIKISSKVTQSREDKLI